jgi:hypothetical protein
MIFRVDQKLSDECIRRFAAGIGKRGEFIAGRSN